MFELTVGKKEDKMFHHSFLWKMIYFILSFRDSKLLECDSDEKLI